MSHNDSFEMLRGRLGAGDPHAARQIFQTYARRLIGLAAARLDRLIRVKIGPEDVVQSVFRSFFTRQREGRFDLHSWNDLWDILVVITLRKCCNHAAYFQAACRDVRREVAEPAGGEIAGEGWEAVAAEPTPEDALQLAETVELLLNSFQEAERAILELSLQGHAVADISAQVGCTERKVYRVRARAKDELQRLSHA